MTTNLAAMKARRKNAKGFTLVELMVVVAIIGILAAIVTLNFAHAKSNSEVSATEANLKEIAAAMEVYYSDNNAYPAASGTVGTGLPGALYLSTTPQSPGPGLAAGARAYNYTADVTPGDNHYAIEDPAAYDSASLAALPQSVAAAAAIPATPTAACGVAGTCKYVGYDNVIGMYAHP